METKKYISIILIILTLTGSVYGQVLLKPKIDLSRLPSNGISDIVIDGDNIWLGTGRGLVLTTDKGNSFRLFTTEDGLGKGSVSALSVNDGVIWVATGFDTTTSLGTLDAGSGLSYSTDNGNTWNHIPQPVDPNNADSLGYSPTTTHMQNVTYDIAFTDNIIWIASWGGGFRKSGDMGNSWTVVTPDDEPFGSLAFYNHRGFSIAAYDNELWFGSVEGINKSTDNGENWVNYNFRSGCGISADFVVALAVQSLPERHIVWGATWKAEGENEFYGVSKSENGGLTWETSLEDVKVSNFAFDGQVVYATTYEGLFKSEDFGQHWYRFPVITEGSEIISTTEYYCVAVNDGEIWVGTADGLAFSDNNGLSWKIFRSFKEPGTGGEPLSYAYPNPFSPMRHNVIGNDGYVRIQFRVVSNTEVTIDIYDFGMNHVDNIITDKYFVSGSYSERWNGKKSNGESVANGVYFYKIKFGDTDEWGKIVVLN